VAAAAFSEAFSEVAYSFSVVASVYSVAESSDFFS
jgi:hypothetical protein